MIPSVDCRIDIFCEVNPSEDPEKLEKVVNNLFENVAIAITQGSLSATSTDISSLSKIHESIQHHKSQRIYLKFLNNNLRDDSTWFYLNKQAAFVNFIALCEHDDESPLGPIKVVICSKNIQRIIDWLTSF